MSAAELRSAAALIRERAEAIPGDGLQAWWFDDEASDLMHLQQCNREHIASWHPAVALAFADLLDDLADVDTVRRPSLVQASALKAARAYLD